MTQLFRDPPSTAQQESSGSSALVLLETGTLSLLASVQRWKRCLLECLCTGGKHRRQCRLCTVSLLEPRRTPTSLSSNEWSLSASHSFHSLPQRSTPVVLSSPTG
ncbi:unnamed protein product [Cuscuta epithymum]|uniref:Uncharacterized protein n=1 Tax=Cuscuta epithymum TaxID=186058 RepID=A0AAV0CND1_9ASTE|nr:unnamed protein product [Cuscuta epithymum]